MPKLKDNRDIRRAPGGSPMSDNTEAKPNHAASRSERNACAAFGYHWKYVVERGHDDGRGDDGLVSRLGRPMTSSAASDSVIECARVNAVTTLRIPMSAGRAAWTGSQRPEFLSNTAGSSSESKNSKWSMPLNMCHTPALK